MAIDFTKAPDEVIVQLINDENGRQFTVADLDLTNLAIAADPVPGRPSFNNVRTSLRVAGAANSGYTNEVTVKYNRVHLRSVFPHSDLDEVRYPNSTDSYQLGENQNLVDIIAQINARHGIALAPSDVFDVPLPTFEGPPPYDPKYVRMEVAGLHKVFTGGINLRILPNDWDLGNLQYTELNGLAYPAYDVPESWTGLNSMINTMATPGYFGTN